MYPTLLALHNFVRWIALIMLVSATVLAIRGYFSGSSFTSLHNAIRHWTATTLHIQMSIGFVLLFSSPIDVDLFVVVHITMMLSAVLIATFGSSLAKRRKEDIEKFRIMALLFSIALAIILLAIPWPFSPLAARPLIRTF